MTIYKHQQENSDHIWHCRYSHGKVIVISTYILSCQSRTSTWLGKMDGSGIKSSTLVRTLLWPVSTWSAYLSASLSPTFSQVFGGIIYEKMTMFIVSCSVYHNLRGYLCKAQLQKNKNQQTTHISLQKKYSKCCIKHSNGTEVSSFFTWEHFWCSKIEDSLAIMFLPWQQLMTRQSTNSTANKNWCFPRVLSLAQQFAISI